MASSITKDIEDYRVSSVLNNDRKMYGKKYLFDRNDETCWNSDRGSPQWIEFSFPSAKSLEGIYIQFQGGFAAKSCVLEAADENCSEKVEFFPKDANASQSFSLQPVLSSKKFKLTFSSSYDFYGRIIIYCIDLLGN